MLKSTQDNHELKFDRILVAISDSPADEEAISLACRLAKQDSCEVYVVYTITMDRALPLDAEIQHEIDKAENILGKIERIARKQRCRIYSDVLQAREVGPAIIDEATERETDLIIMGLGREMRFGRFSIGETVPYVLKNAPCRVILYHQHSKLPSTDL